jgi:hypothetical protein
MVFLTQDRGEPLEAIGRGVALNPCSATALYLSAHAHSIADRHSAATIFAGRALQLSPMIRSHSKRTWLLAKGRFARVATRTQLNASPAQRNPIRN